MKAGDIRPGNRIVLTVKSCYSSKEVADNFHYQSKVEAVFLRFKEGAIPNEVITFDTNAEIETKE